MEQAARESAREAKRAAKEYAQQQAMDEVGRFEAYLEALTTLHADYGDAWDWQADSTTPPPVQPTPRSVAETAARAELEAYRPGLLDRISGEAGRRRADLENTLNRAIAFDHEQNQQALAAYRIDYLVWQTEVGLAPGVLRCEHRACEQAPSHAGAVRRHRTLARRSS